MDEPLLVQVDLRVLDLIRSGVVPPSALQVYLYCCGQAAFGLVEGPTKMGQDLGMPTTSVIRHLRALRAAGLIDGFLPAWLVIVEGQA